MTTPQTTTEIPTQQEALQPSPLSIYYSFKVAGSPYLAVRKNETTESSFHVVSADGLNYGAWQSVENFIKARKAALQEEATGVKSDKLTATPIGKALLSVRSL